MERRGPDERRGGEVSHVGPGALQRLHNVHSARLDKSRKMDNTDKQECGTPDYLVPRDDLEMRNYGVITYDESTHNVDFVVFEDDGNAVMTAYAPLYIMEYPDVGFIAVDHAATYSAPGYRYSLTLYDYSGNIVSNQTFFRNIVDNRQLRTVHEVGGL